MFTLDIVLYFYRQHIIDETGDHFLVVESNELAIPKMQRMKLREQLQRTSHYMQGKGKYYGKSPALDPIIDLVL